jgi:CubicO group peptidase (beta-lactamase class C family)
MTHANEPVATTTARRLQLLLARDQVAGRLPSVVGGVVRDGELVWTGSHGTVTGSGFAPGPDLQYRIGSITKTMVALLVLQLRDAGELDLNDPLQRHLPGTPYDPVPLRSLLSHSSGMHSEPAGEWWERTPGGDVAELLTRLADVPAPFAAGETFHYTNVAFGLLGEVVARRTGTSWFEVLTERVLTPLGMTRTTYLPQAPHARGYSVHHFAGTLDAEPAHDAGAMAPAGQVWSTVADLARYAAFLAAGDEQVLSRRSWESLATPQSGSVATGLATGHGLGFQLAAGGSGTLVGHTGSMPGFLAGLYVDRPRRTGAVALANGTSGMRASGLPVDLLQTLEAAEPTLPPAWEPADAVPVEAAELLGLWHWGNTAYGFGWQGGELVARMLGNGLEAHRFALDAEGRWIGVRGYHHGEQLRVVRRGDGSVSHLTCATFVYTRTPYDTDVAIPGGHPG